MKTLFSIFVSAFDTGNSKSRKYLGMWFKDVAYTLITLAMQERNENKLKVGEIEYFVSDYKMPTCLGKTIVEIGKIYFCQEVMPFKSACVERDNFISEKEAKGCVLLKPDALEQFFNEFNTQNNLNWNYAPIDKKQYSLFDLETIIVSEANKTIILGGNEIKEEICTLLKFKTDVFKFNEDEMRIITTEEPRDMEFKVLK